VSHVIPSDAGIADDVVQPFVLDGSGFHGRLVRLGPAVDGIIGRHDYAPPVAGLLAESLALTGALAAALKFDGVFTLQLSGDGPVKFLVADVTNDGNLRGYAGLRDGIPMPGAVGAAPVPRLLGKGYLAFTVDQGLHTERYQGIVDLIGGRLQDCVHHYFRQSDQFSAVVKLHGGRTADGQWRAGALMLQRSPETEDPNRRDATEEAWREALIMLGSCTDAELIAPDLSPYALLYRLFHEDGVRVFEQRALQFSCRCSDRKVERVLTALREGDLEDLIVDGKITVTCEFCNESRVFDREQLADLRSS
jgi:molecular chaperone Hsp33